MQILTIMHVYNERKMLPYTLHYQKAHDIPLYVIDNMSNDGTWEYLQEQGIPSHRFDTGGAFHLTKLHDEVLRVADAQQPHWFIYRGCDLFWSVASIRMIIEQSDRLGYTRIETEAYHVYRKGYAGMFYDCEYVRRVDNWVGLVAKHGPAMEIRGDSIRRNGGTRRVSAPFYNFGFTKPKEEREETFERRQKAWEEGLPLELGYHYRREKEAGWEGWNVKHIRENPEIHHHLKRLSRLWLK